MFFRREFADGPIIQTAAGGGVTAAAYEKASNGGGGAEITVHRAGTTAPQAPRDAAVDPATNHQFVLG